MKNWFKRFGMLAVLGMLVGGALVAGCNPEPAEEEVVVPADGTEETVEGDTVEEAPAPEATE